MGWDLKIHFELQTYPSSVRGRLSGNTEIETAVIKTAPKEGLLLCFTQMVSITKFVRVETATETLQRHFAFVNSLDNI